MIVNLGFIYKSIDNKMGLSKTLFYLFLINSFYALVNLHIVFTFLFADTDIGSIYDAASASGWLYSTTFNDLEKFGKVILGIQHFGSSDFDDFAKYYNFILARLSILLFISYVLYSSLKYKSDSKVKYLVLIYLVSLFLSKGVALPGGTIYQFLFDYVPFFNIFKTPTEKFYIITNLALSMLIIFVFPKFSDFKNKYFKLILLTPFLFFMLPIYMGFIFSSHFSVGNEVSRIYSDYNEDIDVINYIDNNYSQSAVVYVPGHNNYQIWRQNVKSSNVYSGMDPVQHNLRNNHYIDIALNKDLYDSMTDGDMQRFLYLSELYNVKLLYFNSNHLYPFGTRLSINDLNNFILKGNFKLVYDRHGFLIYEIPNLNNNSNLMSIDSYLKVHTTDFDDGDTHIEKNIQPRTDVHALELEMDMARLESNNFSIPVEGSLNMAFVNFKDRFYSSKLQKKSYQQDFSSLQSENSLKINITNQDYFSWDSLKLKNFNFDNNYILKSNGLEFELKESNQFIPYLYDELFIKRIEENILPRNYTRYIAERELNFKSSFKWVYNKKNDRVWIRNRNFPKDIDFDAISLEFYINNNFNFFTEMFSGSSLKLKKKSVSLFSPLYGQKIYRFQDFPSFYNIKNNKIVFNFLIPRSISDGYYIDELILSSQKRNFFLEDQDNNLEIEPNALFLQSISLNKIDSYEFDNTLWYVKQSGSNDVIIDLNILNSFDTFLPADTIDIVKDIDLISNLRALKDTLNLLNETTSKEEFINKDEILDFAIKILKKDKNLKDELSLVDLSILQFMINSTLKKSIVEISDQSLSYKSEPEKRSKFKIKKITNQKLLEIIKDNYFEIKETSHGDKATTFFATAQARNSISKIDVVTKAIVTFTRLEDILAQNPDHISIYEMLKEKDFLFELEAYELQILSELLYKSKKKEVQIVANNEYNFDYELGNSYTNYTDFYRNLSTNSTYDFINKTVTNDFYNKKIVINNFCYIYDDILIQKTLYNKFVLNLKKIDCLANDHEIFNFEGKYIFSKFLTWINGKSISLDFKKQQEVEQKKEINLVLIIDLFLIVASLIYFRFCNKLIPLIKNLNVKNTYLYVFTFSAICILLNFKILLILLPVFFVNYIKEFYFKKLWT